MGLSQQCKPAQASGLHHREVEIRGDTEQAMGWFADSMRLRDVIGVVSSIEIPLPGTIEDDDKGAEDERGPLAA